MDNRVPPIDESLRLRTSDFLPVIGAVKYIRRVNAFYNSSPEGSSQRESYMENLDGVRSRAVAVMFYNIFLALPVVSTIGHILTE